MKVAWNTALQANSYLAEMIKAFQICYQVNSLFLESEFVLPVLNHSDFVCQLCKLLPPDSTSISRQKTCQLMAAAASVQAARHCKVVEDKVGLSILFLLLVFYFLPSFLPFLSPSPSLTLDTIAGGCY